MNILPFRNPMSDVAETIIRGLAEGVSDERYIEHLVEKWLASPERTMMIHGFNYYNGAHDILKRERMAIGAGGELVPVHNLPNNRIVDNLYAKMVDQKINYLLGNEITVESDSKERAQAVQELFDEGFDKTMRNIAFDAMNAGIAWLYVTLDAAGKIAFKHIEPYEIIPIFRDTARTILDYAVRVFKVDVYNGSSDEEEWHVEFYHANGVKKYIYDGGKLLPDVQSKENEPYIKVQTEEGEDAYSWGRIPLIPFKANSKEISLIRRIKGLQDAINEALSDFQNRMQEDSRNTILVIKNYDGTDLGEFRRNLAQFGAVKVTSMDGADGDVTALQVQVDAGNYNAVLATLKNALIENAMGFDNKDDRLNGSPNEMNIQAMYADIDLDSRTTELEFQESLQTLMEFIDIAGAGGAAGVPVRFTFNRSMILNAAQDIEKCVKSKGIISDETIIAHHPFVDDVNEELKRMNAQREEAVKALSGYGDFGDDHGEEKDEKEEQ